MSDSDNIKTYLNQWVKTATDDKVSIDYAWFQPRMTLVCGECDQQLTAPLPKDSTTIDFSVQEFVKIHAHKGDPVDTKCIHNKTVTFTVGDDLWYKCTKCNHQWKSLLGTPVTADFKKVMIPSAIPELWNDIDGLSGLPVKTQQDNVIPPNCDKDASQIAAQLAKFKKEYNDKEQVEKIKALQGESLTAVQKAALDEMKSKNKINTALLWAQAQAASEAASKMTWGDTVVEEQSAKNLANATLLAQLAKLAKTPAGQAALGIKPEPVEPPKPKVPIKKEITGRKFR